MRRMPNLPETISEISRDIFKKLSTELVFTYKLDDMIEDYSNIDETLKPLLLTEVNLTENFTLNKIELYNNVCRMSNDVKIRSILMAVYDLYKQETVDGCNDMDTSSFVIMLLYQCGFDEYPLQLHTNSFFRGFEMKEKLKLAVKCNEFPLMFVMTQNNTPVQYTMNEYMSALISLDCIWLQAMGYPLTIYGVYVDGTKFHFYKATSTEEYADNFDGSLRIIKYSTLDFMNSYNRSEILTILCYIKNECLKLIYKRIDKV